MFEGFPYTNFHELNTDWIIKIAKDFLDQYTNIQQTITHGLEDLDAKAQQLQAALDAWYDEHSEDIAQELARALEEAITAFNAAADAKAAETIASIPDDYTTLSNTVVNLKNAMSQPVATFFFNPGSSNLKIIYNTANNTITFPAGAIVAHNNNYFVTGSTLTLTNNPDNCWILYFNKDTQTIIDLPWTAHPTNDMVIVGCIFQKLIWIYGVDNSHITILPDASVLNGQAAFYISDDINTVIYDKTQKTLSIPAGVVFGEFGYKFAAAQTLDIEAAALTDNAGTIRFNYESGTYILRSWSSANNSYPIVGVLYNSFIYLNGVPLNGGKTNIGVIGHAANERCTYNPNTKILSIPAGFIMAFDRVHSFQAVTIDLSTVQSSDNAWCIYYRRNSGIYALNWYSPNACNYDALIGYVFGNIVKIFGFEDSTTVKENEIYFFGDSITAGVGTMKTYHMFLTQYYNISAINWGVGGTGYVYNYSGDGFSGNGVEGIGTTTVESGNNNVLKTIQAHHNFSKCCIMAGTNDWSGNINLVDFEQGVRSVIDYALSITPYVVVVTPIKREGTVNGLGYTLAQYAEIIKNVCAEKSVSCYDAYSDLTINPNLTYSKNAFCPDGIHPNVYGHKMLAYGMSEAFKNGTIVNAAN